MMLPAYTVWFKDIVGHEPHPWQRRLGEDPCFRHRLIRVPTGMGKTAGTFLAWLFHRAVRDDASWPRRLVYTLPAHTLIEPVEAALRDWLECVRLADRVALHVLSPALHAQPWALLPDALAVLIGGHDMVLSRALHRGHGTPRALWPAEMALLHHDALWVLDEVHLLEAGLTTSAQLAAFREQDRNRAAWFRPSRCWWMGATLAPARVRSPDAAALIEPLSRTMTGIPSHERQGGIWDIRKHAERRADVRDPADVAALAVERHAPGTLTLCVVHRIELGLVVFRELHKRVNRRAPDARPKLHILHHRFRGAERRAWFQTFLGRGAAMPPAGRIVVCTAVIEASIDVSARVVITELAPWASLVQRAGRAGRHAMQHAQVIVIGQVPTNARDAAPYDMESLAAADAAWRRLAQSFGDASMRALVQLEERIRDRDPALYAALYGPEPGHVIQRRDFDELFDTTADLSGVDLDVSCFVHGQAGDVWVAWRKLDEDLPGPERPEQPGQIAREVIGAVHRDELCPVPLGEARTWVQTIEQGYVLDYGEGAWVRVEARRLVPGMVLVMPASAGGYDRILGWDATAITSTRRATVPVEGVTGQEAGNPAGSPADQWAEMLARAWNAAAIHDDDTGSIGAERTIWAHGGDTARAVAALCQELTIDEPYKGELMLAARWHDAGKAHPAFQHAIAADRRAGHGEASGAPCEALARVPAHAWLGRMSRPGFRHEVAGALALFELLRRAAPDHEALLGGRHRELLGHAGMTPAEVTAEERVAADDPLAAELVALPAASFDRLVYLVASHHGKVRCALDSASADERAAKRERGAAAPRVHGVAEGDALIGLLIEDRTGVARPVARLALHLDPAALGLSPRYGASWVERVARLQAQLGPFALAVLEAVLRAADARASLPVSPSSGPGDDEVRS